MRILLIVNPYATSVNANARAVALGALSDGGVHEVEVVETTRRDHATELAAQGVKEGFEAIVVLGGDGTVNEAANGMLGSDVVLVPLPGGSTNVFARTIGVAKKVPKASRQVRAALDRKSVQSIGLGAVNGRHFLFHVGLGYDAAVVQQVEKRSHLKRRIGQAIFVYAAFSTWFRHYDRKRPRFAFHFPGSDPVTDGYFAIVLNSNPYTFLGVRPFNLSPDTGPERGLVAVTIRSLKVFTLLRLVGSALGRGKLVRRHRKVDYRTDLMSFKVTGHGPFPYQVDGDYLGDVDELDFTYEPDRLRLISIPPGP